MTFDAAALSRALSPFADARRWLVGFSGGLDSTVLLHALVQARLPQPILAVHVNHGLVAEADEWARHCQRLCEQWSVALQVEGVTVKSAGRGWESAARDARYRVFENRIESGDVLLLAQHLNDQAETLLFRLMRGTGVRGLGGIAPERPLGVGRIVRPLLSFSRAELLAYAREQNLSWIDDPSNQADRFDRNYLRHRVVPLLAERWPDMLSRLQQTAAHCRASEALHREVGADDLRAADWREERWGGSIELDRLRSLSPARRHNLIRHWATRSAMDLPEAVHCREIERQLVEAPDAEGAQVNWGNAALRRYRGRLYLTPPDPPATPREPLAWDAREPIELPDGSRLSAASPPPGPLEIRWRRGGERCRPQGRAHSQTLKKLLQEYSLEPWLRDRVPLIYCGGELAAVGDLWICADVAAGERMGFRWHLEGALGQIPN